ncbi:leucine-responsive transcriptional regulator LEU3 [Nakaseomyces bracarensis]|uniref:leucine-responsive transcriptional regulator LEU3 n=1 Tax=Nakaseomyces bracarensis TaxID=273131 RepID=UPI0038722724
MESVGSELNTPNSDNGDVISVNTVDSNTRQSSETPVSVTGAGKVRKKKVACVECRQQKSKCDAHDRAPEPCTRCQKKGVPCILKRDFRRTYKRARNEAIEKRFKELTATLSNLSSEEILRRIEEEQQQLLDNSNFTKDKIKKMKDENMKKWKHEDLHTAKLPSTSPNYDDDFDSYSTQNGPVKTDSVEIAYPKFTEEYVFKELTDEQLKCSPKSLGDVYVSSSEISELFQEFGTNYHKFLPVVDLSKGAERIYNLSPCLFWVILLIGLRRKTGATSLMKRLSILVKSVLSEITISPIIRYTPSDKDDPVLNVASVYSVQAFLLYTFWPPLTSSLSADTSWNTIGTAMFQAIRVGLNCADFSKEYASANSELINEQIRTWVCCNIVSQLIASSFGFPAFTSFDHCIINSTKITNLTAVDENIPLPLKQLTHIARFENQVSNTISSNGTNVVGIVERESKHPLIEILNQQLAHLELALEDTRIDDIRRFSLLVAKTHLLMYYFNDPLLTDNYGSAYRGTFSVNKTEALFETKKGLIKTYNAAVDFLGHAHNMWRSNPTIVKYLPGVFVLNIWQSACIISKLANSSIAPLLDIGRGKKSYQNAVLLTYSASVLKHDMAYRSSGIMKSIWSLFANMYESWRKDQHGREGNSNHITGDFNLGVTVRSRMAVSIFFDCLYILKEKCGMAKLEREARTINGGEDNIGEKNEDEDDYDSNINENGGNNIKDKTSDLQSIKNPERNARRIIETIPLDPNPINAASSSSNGSSINTPNSNGHEILHTNNILSKLSPENAINSRSLNNSPLVKSDNNTIDYGKSLIKPPETSMFEIVKNQKPQLNGNYRNIMRGENNEINFNNTKSPSNLAHNGQNSNRFTAPQVDSQNNQFIVPLSEDQINTTPTNDSPNSIMANWDNWESDMVWKDVDILMNEFAFNPTL